MRMLNRPNRLSRTERIGSAQVDVVFVPLGYLIAYPNCFLLSRTNQHMPRLPKMSNADKKIKETAHALGSCGAVCETVPASVSAPFTVFGFETRDSRRRATGPQLTDAVCHMPVLKRNWSKQGVYYSPKISHVWGFDFGKKNVWYVTLWCEG